MKKLTDLLEQLDYQCLQGTTDKEISSVVFDSRKAGPDSLFFCIKGAVSDGHTYAKEVAEKGASVLVVQEPVEVPKHVTVIQVPDSRYAMACISAKRAKKLSFRWIRMLWDTAATMMGILLGMKLGAITVLMVLTLGPVVSWFGEHVAGKLFERG